MRTGYMQLCVNTHMRKLFFHFSAFSLLRAPAFPLFHLNAFTLIRLYSYTLMRLIVVFAGCMRGPGHKDRGHPEAGSTC